MYDDPNYWEPLKEPHFDEIPQEVEILEGVLVEKEARVNIEAPPEGYKEVRILKKKIK